MTPRIRVAPRRVQPSKTLAVLAAATAAAIVAMTAPPALQAQDGPEDPLAIGSVADALEFRLIGPVNPSGRVTALAAPAGDGGRTMYAGFASSGLWKTENHGVTWASVFDDGNYAAVSDVAVAPSDPDIVWLGTGERNSLRSNSWGDGVYRSTDAGRSWDHMGLEETTQIGRVVIHPEDPDVVYVAAMGHLWGANPERGVYRTTDGGASWEQVLFVNDTTAFVDLEMDPRDPDVLLAAGWHRLRWGGGRMEGAGAGSGIWRSTDGGDTWMELTVPEANSGLPTDRMGRIGIEYARSAPDNVYAVIQVGRSAFGPSISEEGGVFRSRDGGLTWTRVHDISAVPDYFYNEVWVDPTDPERLYLGQTILQASEDGGQTFESMFLRGVHVDQHAMWIDPEDNRHLVLGNDGGVYTSWDQGRTWRHNRIPVVQFYETSVDTTKVPYHVCGGSQDNGTWCGPSATREQAGIHEFEWYSVWGGDGFHHQISPDRPEIRFGESQYGNMGRWNVETGERTGLTPHAEDAGPESGYEFRFDWNTPFVLSHHDPTVLYMGGNHLFRFTDRGESWEILGPDMSRGNRFDPEPDSAHTSYRSLHSIAESTLTADVLWTGSNDGLIWVSRDRGATWTNVTDNIPDDRPKHCWVGEIEASYHDPARAYVAYDCHRRDDYAPYVFRTDDYGESWTSVTGNLPHGGGSWVVREDFENPDLLFVGTEQGLWVSLDRGERWARMTNGIPPVPVKDMDMVWRARDLAVGTYGRSVYILQYHPLQEMTPEVRSVPAHVYRVEPARQFNYQSTFGSRGDDVFIADNPAYGATIWYHLREDQGDDVRLTVRDPDTDEAVVTLTGPGRPGLHRVQWDLERQQPRARRLGDPTSQNELRRVEAGTYEVTLRVDGETYSREIVVEEGWVEDEPGRVR